MYWLGRLAVAAAFLMAGPVWALSDSASDGQTRIQAPNTDGPVYFERDSSGRAVTGDSSNSGQVQRENGQTEIQREGKAERGLQKAGEATGKALDTAGRAIGKGLEKAGEGMNRAGEWVQDQGD